MPGEGLLIKVCCHVLGIPYAAQAATLDARDPARTADRAVRGVHTEPHGSSGLRRVHAEPTLGPSPPVGHGAVELAFATTMWVGRPAGRHLRPQLPAPARGRHSGGMTSR